VEVVFAALIAAVPAGALGWPAVGVLLLWWAGRADSMRMARGSSRRSVMPDALLTQPSRDSMRAVAALSGSRAQLTEEAAGVGREPLGIQAELPFEVHHPSQGNV
jgi:hypothetical protein